MHVERRHTQCIPHEPAGLSYIVRINLAGTIATHVEPCSIKILLVAQCWTLDPCSHALESQINEDFHIWHLSVPWLSHPGE